MRKLETDVKMRPRISGKARNQLVAYAFLAPALIFYLVFKYIPIIEGLYISFFKVSVVDLPGEFIGFDNYIRAFEDPTFWSALFHNLKFWFFGMLFTFWPPILMAFLINEITGRGKTIIRLLYYIPAIIPAVALNVIMKYFWQPDYGLANYIMGLFGLPEQLWLNDEKLVYYCMIMPNMIFGAGAGFLVYLAALKDVPQDMFEASIIDGAGFFTRVFRIALPQMRHIIMLMFIMNMISVVNMVDNVMVMTGGGPAGSTTTAILYAYDQATDFMDYGYAISMANIVMFIALILTAIQLKFTNKNGEV